MRDAMSALDQVIAFCGNKVRDEDVTVLLGLVEPKILGQAVRAIAQSDLPALLAIVGDLVESGQDLHNFCRRFSGQLRNLMVLKAGISDPALLGVPESLLPELTEQAQLFSREDLLRLFESFQKIENGMKYATQVRFHLEMGLIELAHLSQLRPLEEIIAEFSSFEESGNPGGPDVRVSSGHPRPKPPIQRPADHNPISKLKSNSRVKSPAPESESSVAPEPASSGKAGMSSSIQDPRAFLLKIAGGVGRESLESLLQSLDGARLDGNRLVLEPGSANDFVLRQIGENMQAITQAAQNVLGNKVKVVLNKAEPQQAPGTASGRDTTPKGEILEKAKREPVVQSFLDVFPGPVKAEKMDT
jgi:DNA polymerase-3 subunit gamma/tau